MASSVPSALSTSGVAGSPSSSKESSPLSKRKKCKNELDIDALINKNVECIAPKKEPENTDELPDISCSNNSKALYVNLSEFAKAAGTADQKEIINNTNVITPVIRPTPAPRRLSLKKTTSQSELTVTTSNIPHNGPVKDVPDGIQLTESTRLKPSIDQEPLVKSKQISNFSTPSAEINNNTQSQFPNVRAYNNVSNDTSSAIYSSMKDKAGSDPSSPVMQIKSNVEPKCNTLPRGAIPKNKNKPRARSPETQPGLPRKETSRMEDPILNMRLKGRIAPRDVEAYLNWCVSDPQTVADFELVPKIMEKSTKDAETTINRPKNRFRNNFPYDENRVRLSLMNDNPSTDYINASHVTGYGGKLTYIAAQGPKPDKTNTMGDFWRMVREQNVTAVIMVANFIEMGKSKVGKYLPEEGYSLRLDDQVINILKIKKYRHFSVSHVQVSHNDYQHYVQHYHYTEWPDHDTPDDLSGLAAMFRHFLKEINKGCVIAHCSAGIGRTGTVLLVLLLLDMLDHKEYLDPIEALTSLRSCRSRQVDSTAQYKLALKLVDEILFGTSSTLVPAAELKVSIHRLLQDTYHWYKLARDLPFISNTQNLDNEKFRHLNRNPNNLPPEGRRVYLNMESGEEISQYINAVPLDTFSKPKSVISTEHPTDETITRFWKMVTQNNCPIIVFLHTFTDHKNFPILLPEQGTEQRIVDGNLNISIRTREVKHSKNDFKQTEIDIAKDKGPTSRVTVYQVESWPWGSPCPKSSEGLLHASGVLLQNRDPVYGPPLISCGDGLSGVGLLLASMWMVERLKVLQDVDVYRTVVHIRRQREQFINDESQFSYLYCLANSYIENLTGG